MSRNWRTALFALFTLLAISACSSNYKFDDDEYRPLGDPQIINRGN